MEPYSVPGICRCCAADGPSKDLSSQYHWMGEEEIYNQMLRDCFSISLSSEEEGYEGGICELCINQLRCAYNFKKQVLLTEERFKNKLIGHDNKSIALVKKEQSIEMEEEHLLSETELGDSDNDNEYVQVKAETGAEVDAEYVPEVKPKRQPKKRPAPAKRVKPETTKNPGGGAKRQKRNGKGSATPERTEHRVNLRHILQYSNASPFRDKTMKGFSCLYCSKYFKSIQEFRAHTAQQSEKDRLNSLLDYKLSYNPIKVDITDLRCTLCDSPMATLSQLKEHLSNIHEKKIFKNIKDIILPFNLMDGNNYTCVVCCMSHVSFKNLYLHMSSHYSNYFCEECGTAYITIAALRKHKKTHDQGTFNCQYCWKSFPTFLKKRTHEKGAHFDGGWFRYKCNQCAESFVSYYERSEHLARAHDAARVTYPCNACSKVYKKKFELSRHIKHTHLQQKNFKCEHCDAEYFSKRGLIDHMHAHFDTDTYTCDVCGKRFTKLRAFKDHARLHSRDSTTHTCVHCKKVFYQKCGLARHLKLHQNDLDIFKEFEDVQHLVDDRAMTLKEVAAESRKGGVGYELALRE